MNKRQLTKIIKNNKRFKDNEDLLDDFIECSKQKLNGIIEDIEDKEVITTFAEKIISNSIIEVLKKENRFRKVSEVNISKQTEYSKFAPEYSQIQTVGISKLKQVYSVLKRKDEKDGTKYLEIFNLKYVDNKSIEEISETLKIENNKIISILGEMSEIANKVINV